MERNSHWFENRKDSKRPVAVHWKGHTLEVLTVAFSAVCAAAFVLRMLEPITIPEAIPFFAFSLFAMAQGTKYYFYHEKTKR
ncbi:MAG: hypothetical protein H7333_11300 [Bdellovibrionales bacterium]|nr:hypothetical protein [Oligoflexia bacterium]